LMPHSGSGLRIALSPERGKWLEDANDPPFEGISGHFQRR
jgi:hypothetical protein